MIDFLKGYSHDFLAQGVDGDIGAHQKSGISDWVTSRLQLRRGEEFHFFGMDDVMPVTGDDQWGVHTPFEEQVLNMLAKLDCNNLMPTIDVGNKFRCSNVVPSISLALSSVPFFNGTTDTEFLEALAPTCYHVEFFWSTLYDICVHNDAPAKLLYATGEVFIKADDALAFIWDNENAKKLPQYVLDINMTEVKAFAASYDSIDYSVYAEYTCNGGGGWPFDGGLYGLHFWIKTMFTGLFLHLPPAVVTWHLVNRYATIMNVQTANIEREMVSLGGKALL